MVDQLGSDNYSANLAGSLTANASEGFVTVQDVMNGCAETCASKSIKSPCYH
jgi:hypothetical protein